MSMSSLRQNPDGRRNSDPAVLVHEPPPMTSSDKKSKRRFFGAMTSSTNSSTIDGGNKGGPSSEDEKPKKGKTFAMTSNNGQGWNTKFEIIWSGTWTTRYVRSDKL